jgi:hypothetical protein
MSAQYYGVDLSNLDEEQRGDASQLLHGLQDTCMRVVGNVGVAYGNPSNVKPLQDKGYNVKPVDVDCYGNVYKESDAK